MDGISITYSQNPRKHVWSFASAGQPQSSRYPCPDFGGAAHQALLVKTIFVHLVMSQNLPVMEKIPYFSVRILVSLQQQTWSCDSALQLRQMK